MPDTIVLIGRRPSVVVILVAGSYHSQTRQTSTPLSIPSRFSNESTAVLVLRKLAWRLGMVETANYPGRAGWSSRAHLRWRTALPAVLLDAVLHDQH
jgi:hypothetical protein